MSLGVYINMLKPLHLLFLSLFLTSAVGKQPSDESAQISVAKKYLANAILKLESRQKLCKNKEIVLDKAIFDGMALTKIELGHALRYFDLKSETNCSLQESSNVATWQYVVGTISAGAGRGTDLSLVLHFAKELVEAEANYNLYISKDKQQIIESKIDINQPINLIESAIALGL